MQGCQRSSLGEETLFVANLGTKVLGTSQKMPQCIYISLKHGEIQEVVGVKLL